MEVSSVKPNGNHGTNNNISCQTYANNINSKSNSLSVAQYETDKLANIPAQQHSDDSDESQVDELQVQDVLNKLLLSVIAVALHEVSTSPAEVDGGPRSSSSDDHSCDLVIDSSETARDQQQEASATSSDELQDEPSTDIHKSESTLVDKPESANDEADKSEKSAELLGEKELKAEPSISPAPSKDQPKVESAKVGDSEDSDEVKNKDMVMLRNLEISPPPPATETSASNPAQPTETTINPKVEPVDATPARKKRRTAAAPEASSDVESSEGQQTGRSKRQRTQTKLFQAGDTPRLDESQTSLNVSASTRSTSSRASTSCRKKPKTATTTVSDTTVEASTSELTTSNDPETVHLTNDLQDVIFYEKNDYLAIRNEENSFYLCQLAENVRVKRPLIKVKWLDTSNAGRTYFLTSHFDKVPQKSIIMPVSLNKIKSDKKGEQLFTLDDQDRDNIMERLKRSINALSSSLPSSQKTVTEEEK